VACGVRESSVGSSNCLLVGKTTISVKGIEAPRRTAPTATHGSCSGHAACQTESETAGRKGDLQNGLAEWTCRMVARW
jgi:hypothetical protein